MNNWRQILSVIQLETFEVSVFSNHQERFLLNRAKNQGLEIVGRVIHLGEPIKLVFKGTEEQKQSLIS